MRRFTTIRLRQWVAVSLLAAVMSAALLAGCGSSVASRADKAAYWPTKGWRTSTPEEQGIDSAGLLRALDQVDKQGVNLRSMLVIRNGYLVSEVYWNPYSAAQPVDVASVTKSVTSSLVGIAIDKSLLKGADQKLLDPFAGRTIANIDERKRAITLGDVLSMTSGLDYNDPSGFGEMEESADWVSFMLDRPIAADPGTRFNYSTGATQLLSGVLSAVSGVSAREFANQNLFAPLGIGPVPVDQWPSDPQGVSLGGRGLWLTPRDMAKIGYLYLKGGKWDGQQVVSSEWVAASTAPHATKDNGYGEGYLWTLDDKQGSFEALGMGGQQIIVLPAKQLVVVFTAGLATGQDRDFLPLKSLVDDYIVPAITSDKPLPANSAACAALADRTRKAVCPLEPVPALPPVARAISGKAFRLEDNPNGWQTMSLLFPEGQSQAYITVNGVSMDPPIGLDHVYRVGSASGGAASVLRGRWQADGTFIVDQTTMGGIEQVEDRLTFVNDRITIVSESSLFDAEGTMQGQLEDQ